MSLYNLYLVKTVHRNGELDSIPVEAPNESEALGRAKAQLQIDEQIVSIAFFAELAD